MKKCGGPVNASIATAARIRIEVLTEDYASYVTPAASLTLGCPENWVLPPRAISGDGMAYE